MFGNELKVGTDRNDLAIQAVRLAEEATTVLQDLASYEPSTALALAERIYGKVAEKSKTILNSVPSQNEAAKQHPGTVAHSVLSSTSDDKDLVRGTGEIKSFLRPNEINQRSLQNRRLRGTLFDDIVLLLLLANDGRELVASDIKNEFSRLQIKIGSTTLLSRIARLRDEEALEPVSVSGTGSYRLSAGGKKAAHDAREKRWRINTGVDES